MPQPVFTPATKAQAKLRAALTGPAGSGKTCSALRMATGIGGRIAVIDTERGSASKYADRFRFDTCQLADRTIEGYLAALGAAAKAGYDVLIIDSLSHAWQELLQEVDRLAKARFSGNTWAAWSEGTPKQRRLIDGILDWPGHVIATMRSKTEWNQQADEKTGRLRPVRIGLAPEQGKGCEYEFDLLLELSTEHVGTVIKDRTGKFQDKVVEKPDEAFGRALAEWLAEGAPAKAPATPVPESPKPSASPAPQAPTPTPPAGPACPGEAQRSPDLSRLKALVVEHNLTDQQQAAWCRHFKVERLDQLTQHQVDAIVAKIERSVTKGAWPMAYDWEKAATQEGGDYAERIPAGVHDVEIRRVLFGSKKGGAFRSRDGDPQIMLIFSDREGREASQMVTLSDKAGWVLARLLSAAGADMKRMKADGVLPRDFANQEFARANLVGRRLRADIQYKRGGDGKEYADVTPVRTRPAASPAQPAVPEDGLDPDSIPY